MIYFEFKGIKVEFTADHEPLTYYDVEKKKRTRIGREVRVYLHFWEFMVHNGDLYDWAFVKSVLHYFQQCYWRRNRNGDPRINFSKLLSHEHHYAPKMLHFTGRQKDGENYLYIQLFMSGTSGSECYLDIHEVGILDLAVGKAINLMTPDEYPRY